LRLPFLADDYLFLDQVRGRSLLAALNVSRDPLQNYIRPVSRQLYFWIVSSWTGASPIAAHALNLGVFLMVIAVVYSIACRLANAKAATVAAAVVGLHYAVDVPVRWVSGSQDLLATLGAVGCILLFMHGRLALSALVLLAALLSKETVVLTPLVAGLVARRPGEAWRRTVVRAWPLLAVTAVWAIFWLLTIHRDAVAKLSVGPSALAAAIAHLPQVLVGAEWRSGARVQLPDSAISIGPVLFVLTAIALSWHWGGPVPDEPSTLSTPPTSVPPPDHLSAVALGLVWALAGSLPVTAVASFWNAYYYLFALCGLALTLGALFARGPRIIAVVAVALLAWGSEIGRRLDEFATAPNPWNAHSHLNRFYFDRAMVHVDHYLASLRRLRPTLPHRSTLFFSNVAPMVAWQGGDGALLRWAYRDSTIHSYYISGFSLRLARAGPVFVFDTEGDHFVDLSEQPHVFRDLALSLITADHLEGARDALTLELARDSVSRLPEYWLGWTALAAADTTHAFKWLSRSGCIPDRGPSPELVEARQRLADGDTVGAETIVERTAARHALDPAPHAMLAHLMLSRRPAEPVSAMESFAALVLNSADPGAWRRWALIQYQWGSFSGAYESLQRYFALAGAPSSGDVSAHALAAQLRAYLPGGAQVPEALRRE
jgi:hypothetical protein